MWRWSLAGTLARPKRRTVASFFLLLCVAVLIFLCSWDGSLRRLPATGQFHAFPGIRLPKGELQKPLHSVNEGSTTYLTKTVYSQEARRKKNKAHRGLKLPRDKFKQTIEKRTRLCGRNWQEDYAKLHEDILKSNKPRRFLVYLCGGAGYGCGGYGNRISAISTLFFLAVLTKRAFLIDWNYSISLEDYLQPKNIRWNYSLASLEGLETRRQYWGNGVLADPNATMPVTSIKRSSSSFGEWARKVNFLEHFSHPVEVVTSMWYGGEHIWNNPHLFEHMSRLGMQHDNSARFSLIGCAFDFLFTKVPRLETYLTQMKESVGMKLNEPFVGLHIRTGDAAFGVPIERKGAVRTQDYNAFFTCATNFESAIIKANPNVTRSNIKWFLASDDANIKRTALKAYGAEKLVTLNVKLEHSAVFRRKLHVPSDEGMIGVLLDNFILAECDFLVLSKSSFSNTALGLTLHSDGSYTYGENCKFT